MPRVDVHVPGRDDPEKVQVGSGETLLLGRDPDATRVDRELLKGRAVPHKLDAPTVSANHVLIWRDGEDTCLEDVGSRHGSWLRLPPRVRVSVRGDAPIDLHLTAVSAAQSSVAREPVDAEWTGRDDYGQSIARAVKAWLTLRGLAAEVTLRPRRGKARRPDEGFGQMSLAGGEDLEVVPAQTMDGRWPELWSSLYRYVGRQNVLYEAEEDAAQEGLILSSRAGRAAHRQVVEAALSGVRSLLLVGPSGSGKEGLARCFHRHTGRSGPFVARNCSMFSKEFLRSELFGAEAGAFTGATHRIVGAVDRASGGTLFLDELGEMPAEVQPMLLRFLDSGEYEPLGSYGQPKRADLRIVCATNKELRAAAQSGEFRADLWYRLSVSIVAVPSLADRPEDVVAFLRLRKLPSDTSAWDALSPEAQELVTAHVWGGNFRELGNFVDRLGRLRGDRVTAAQAREALAQGSLEPPRAARAAVAPEGASIQWEALSTEAVGAFAEDMEKPSPETWDDVKTYVEKYLKPLIFAHLTGVARNPSGKHDVRALADAVESDRGTAQKQIERFVERFGK